MGHEFARSKSIPAYAGMIVAYAFALLSNPTVVMFPLVLLLLDYWPTERLISGEGSTGEASKRFRKVSLIVR